jgi:serine/threonine protein kinase
MRPSGVPKRSIGIPTFDDRCAAATLSSYRKLIAEPPGGVKRGFHNHEVAERASRYAWLLPTTEGRTGRVDTFLETLQRQTAGHIDLAQLSAGLERMLRQAPESRQVAANALDNAHRRGILPATEYRALLAVLDGRRVPADATKPSQTAKRGPAPDATAPRSGPGVAAVGTTFRARPSQPQPEALGGEEDAAIDDTEHRLADPHTWTHVGEDSLFIGRILGRHYQLERKIGEGGMGVVYLAKDLVEADFSEQPFLAIKVLKEDFREHPDALKALHEEVRKSRALSHQNIVAVYTFDRDAAVVFMTMEYLEGKSLNELIEEDFARGMPFAQAWPIIEGAGRALAYAHDRGVVHSDFKPSNVFVTAGGRPKVLDFGIARAMRHGRGRNFDAASLGALTEAYASCEMLDGQAADVRDDIYAYACVIYELLCGRHVFGGDSAAKAREDKLRMQPLPMLSKLQNRTLARALAFDRSQRTGSVEEVIEGLRPRAQVRRTGLVVAGVTLTVAGLAGAGWWISHRFFPADEDVAFVNSLLKANAEATDSVDPERVSLLMEQGNSYLDQASAEFNPAFLSEGVSTAYGAFQAVLKQDPANREAANKILQIVKMYEDQATKLEDQGQFKRALNLIGYALKIDPLSPILKKRQLDLRPKAASETDTPP